jgi:diacylglycerol kinase (ATP)
MATFQRQRYEPSQQSEMSYEPGMSSTHPWSPARRLSSFAHAFRGAAFLLRSEPHAQVHAAATLVCVAAGWHFRISRSEWCFVALALTLVWSSEATNTAVERLSDRVSPEFHPLIRAAKDVAAAAVLFAAFGAIGVGCMVFGPYLLAWTSD